MSESIGNFVTFFTNFCDKASPQERNLPHMLDSTGKSPLLYLFYCLYTYSFSTIKISEPKYGSLIFIQLLLFLLIHDSHVFPASSFRFHLLGNDEVVLFYQTHSKPVRIDFQMHLLVYDHRQRKSAE